MKTLLILVFVGVLVGTQSRAIRWKEMVVLATVVVGIVGWQTFNIIFRYIGVE